MALELIVNLLLLGFSIFCYFYVGATMPVLSLIHILEEAGNGYGYMLYRTQVKGYNRKMKVKAVQASDRVQYYLNGVFEGTQYQNNSGEELELFFGPENRLDLLVENICLLYTS